MRRLVLGVVFALGVGSGAFALTNHPFSNPGVDVRVFPPPCSPLDVPGSAVAAAVPVFTSAGEVTALVFTCENGEVFVRIYAEASTLPPRAPVAYPGPMIPGPYAEPLPCPGLSPFPGGICQDGGWLPVGHPARRQ